MTEEEKRIRLHKHYIDGGISNLLKIVPEGVTMAELRGFGYNNTEADAIKTMQLVFSKEEYVSGTVITRDES